MSSQREERYNRLVKEKKARAKRAANKAKQEREWEDGKRGNW